MIELTMRSQPIKKALKMNLQEESKYFRLALINFLNKMLIQFEKIKSSSQVYQLINKFQQVDKLIKYFKVKNKDYLDYKLSFFKLFFKNN